MNLGISDVCLGVGGRNGSVFLSARKMGTHRHAG